MTESLSRRTLLLAGSAAAVLLPLTRGAQAANPYALAPRFTAAWRAQKTFSGARISQLAGGVRIDTPGKAAQADVGQLALWALNPVQGDFELAFTYKVTARVKVAGGSFGTFYLDTRGEGSARYPEAVPSWVGITPSDQTYGLHARGLRFSFATYNASTPSLSNEVRLRPFSFGPVGAEILPLVRRKIELRLGTAYNVRVRRQGTRLDVLVTPAAGGTTVGQTWTNEAIGRYGEGYIGFRWRAQDCEVTSAALTPL